MLLRLPILDIDLIQHDVRPIAIRSQIVINSHTDRSERRRVACRLIAVRTRHAELTPEPVDEEWIENLLLLLPVLSLGSAA